MLHHKGKTIHDGSQLCAWLLPTPLVAVAGCERLRRDVFAEAVWRPRRAFLRLCGFGWHECAESDEAQQRAGHVCDGSWLDDCAEFFGRQSVVDGESPYCVRGGGQQQLEGRLRAGCVGSG